VAKVCLLHVHRLERTRPSLKTPIAPGLSWPTLPHDMPSALGKRVGGFDLSEGASPQPVSWVNELDDSSPDSAFAFVYLRQPVNVDIHPDWKNKRAKKCKWTPPQPPAQLTARCCQFSSKPDGKEVECSWTCDCPCYCARRAMQRGGGYRLQVFKTAERGWCLRTLHHIDSGAFVMEYCGERVSRPLSDDRAKNEPDVDIYLMETSASKRFCLLDALWTRNHAAFAAFACRRSFANLEKKPVLIQHWDATVQRIGFFATRDINPGEELTYLRKDEEPKQNSGKNCACGQPNCSGRI